MARRLAWLTGAAGLAGFALYRARAWRRLLLRARDGEAKREAPLSDEARSDPRAEELRRKLAESQSLVGERDEFESAETTVDRAEPAPPLGALSAGEEEPGSRDPIAERRQAVQEQGRATVEAMRRPSAEEEQGPIHDA